MTVTSECPVCHATHEYGAELIGRYTLCLSCHSRFYVVVPPLAKEGDQPIAGPKVAIAPKQDTTLDDLLWDTQKGSQYIIQSIRRQEAAAKVTGWLIAAVILLALVNLAGTTLLLLRP